MTSMPFLTANTYTELDFKPVVETPYWIVALMNWSERFSPEALGVVERHAATDEVFVLQKGRGILFVEEGSGIQVVDMVPGVVYNVGKGTYHNVIGTKDMQMLIVENPDHLNTPDEFRDLTPDEVQYIRSCFPDWLTRIAR